MLVTNLLKDSNGTKIKTNFKLRLNNKPQKNVLNNYNKARKISIPVQTIVWPSKAIVPINLNNLMQKSKIWNVKTRTMMTFQPIKRMMPKKACRIDAKIALLKPISRCFKSKTKIRKLSKESETKSQFSLLQFVKELRSKIEQIKAIYKGILLININWFECKISPHRNNNKKHSFFSKLLIKILTKIK